ncbi:SCO7613 C-terminal domain-containing membrane protein, partial [Nocardiopsis salina]|uniref:SCO7613 C-terminal domain-containing membrane protein n=1 Tax=Nocardiopsis salina TaxID=245836 RepID=UPI000362C0EE
LWAVAALALAIAFGVRGELVALGLACLGLVSLCTAVRPDRRPLALGGTALMLAALWTALASWDVTVPEAYTAPPALAAIVVGREWSRRADRSSVPSSWLAHSGGLLLLLAPSTVLAVVQDEPVLRILAVVAAGLAVTLWGLRSRLRAPLVIGGAALLAVSVRAFGPPFMDLLVELPNWLPFAVVGAVLLAVGARYEASLRGLRTLRRAYSAMQ